MTAHQVDFHPFDYLVMHAPPPQFDSSDFRASNAQALGEASFTCADGGLCFFEPAFIVVLLRTICLAVQTRALRSRSIIDDASLVPTKCESVSSSPATIRLFS